MKVFEILLMLTVTRLLYSRYNTIIRNLSHYNEMVTYGL